MENQGNKGHELKDIQQSDDQQANGQVGTSLAEATAQNKEMDAGAKPLASRPDDIENAMDDEDRMGNRGL
ncbi:MAG: hypothetical protein REI78_01815 [Pedobacter sp.]|nr:hypothetical protein [Pedobacter sp.]